MLYLLEIPINGVPSFKRELLPNRKPAKEIFHSLVSLNGFYLIYKSLENNLLTINKAMSYFLAAQ